MTSALRLLALATPALLGACATSTEPVHVGPSTYLIDLGTRGGDQGDPEVLRQTIRSAGQFCADHGRVVEVISTTWTRPQGEAQQGSEAQRNHVLFKCLLLGIPI